MWNSSRYIVCFSLLLCGLFGECFGMALVPKDKRGWTLNSAGYLLGHPLLPFYSPLPKADAHQTLPDKGGLASKREALEDFYSVGQDPSAQAVHSSDDTNLQTLMDFLSYLNLRASNLAQPPPCAFPKVKWWLDRTLSISATYTFPTQITELFCSSQKNPWNRKGLGL